MDLKDTIKRVGLRYGFEIRRAWKHPSLINFVKDRQIDLVADVGANEGQFGQSLRLGGYAGRITSFEPVSTPFRQLEGVAGADGNWEVKNCALGAEKGQMTINVAESTLFSSALAIKKSAADWHGGAKYTRTESVPMLTLDDVDLGKGSNILVKIDTQGFERQVIEGGKTTVKRAKGVLLELPVIALYEGSWRLGEAIEYMNALGFVPAQLEPVSYHRQDQQSVLEIDCLFRPKSSAVD